MAKEKKAKNENVKSLVGTSLISIAARGRTFEGFVTKKFPKRVVLEFERTVYVQKYERFYKKKTRLHARLPDSIANEINVGDYIQVKECRPLSKIINFIVIKKIVRDKEAKK
jgi:small subunit ribosomal protein S17